MECRELKPVWVRCTGNCYKLQPAQTKAGPMTLDCQVETVSRFWATWEKASEKNDALEHISVLVILQQNYLPLNKAVGSAKVWDMVLKAKVFSLVGIYLCVLILGRGWLVVTSSYSADRPCKTWSNVCMCSSILYQELSF